MTDNYFEDTGIFYANQDMVNKQLILSMNSGLVYDISDSKDVMLIRKVSSDAFFAIARKDIESDSPCLYGQASIYREVPESECKLGKLIWEL